MRVRAAASYTKAEKEKWLRKVYFGTTDNPDDDVNPFTSMDDFYAATVGDLDWGIGAGARNRSKTRFAENTRRVLQTFDVRLAAEDIEASVKLQKTKNTDVVKAWVKAANFPPKES